MRIASASCAKARSNVLLRRDVQKGERAEADLKKLGDVRFVKAVVLAPLDAHNLVSRRHDAFARQTRSSLVNICRHRPWG